MCYKVHIKISTRHLTSHNNNCRMPNCAIVNCKMHNRHPFAKEHDVRFHVFPRDERLCTIWMDKCRRSGINIRNGKSPGVLW